MGAGGDIPKRKDGLTASKMKHIIRTGLSTVKTAQKELPSGNMERPSKDHTNIHSKKIISSVP